MNAVVAGPLCESGDVFTQADGGVVLQRELPTAKVGDPLVFHDAGAYGASMSSNCNTRPLVAEVLVDGEAMRLLWRRQTVAELLALEAVTGVSFAHFMNAQVFQPLAAALAHQTLPGDHLAFKSRLVG